MQFLPLAVDIDCSSTSVSTEQSFDGRGWKKAVTKRLVGTLPRRHSSFHPTDCELESRVEYTADPQKSLCTRFVPMLLDVKDPMIEINASPEIVVLGSKNPRRNHVTSISPIIPFGPISKRKHKRCNSACEESKNKYQMARGLAYDVPTQKRRVYLIGIDCPGMSSPKPSRQAKLYPESIRREFGTASSFPFQRGTSEPKVQPLSIEGDTMSFGSGKKLYRRNESSPSPRLRKRGNRNISISRTMHGIPFSLRDHQSMLERTDNVYYEEMPTPDAVPDGLSNGRRPPLILGKTSRQSRKVSTRSLMAHTTRVKPQVQRTLKSKRPTPATSISPGPDQMSDCGSSDVPLQYSFNKPLYNSPGKYCRGLRLVQSKEQIDQAVKPSSKNDKLSSPIHWKHRYKQSHIEKASTVLPLPKQSSLASRSFAFMYPGKNSLAAHELATLHALTTDCPGKTYLRSCGQANTSPCSILDTEFFQNEDFYAAKCSYKRNLTDALCEFPLVAQATKCRWDFTESDCRFPALPLRGSRSALTAD